MAYSKIILNGETLMDVTSDTVDAGDLLSGETATKNDGTKITGNISTVTHPNPKAAITSSTGVVTATHVQSTGYVTGGTTTSTTQLTSKAAATINTSTADQTIASYRWLTGTQTIKSVTTSNLTAANIASGVIVKVGDANNASRISQVTGTYAPAVSALTVTPTESQQVFNATGVYGYKPVTINAISSTYVGTGVTRRTYNDITFSSTSGYISIPSGYYETNSGKSVTTQAAQTIYPSTADQTIASYRWLTGTQTIKSVTTSNLTAANIAEGVVVKVGDANNASRITQITGTHKGGGGHDAVLLNDGIYNTTAPMYMYVSYNDTRYYTNEDIFNFNEGDTISTLTYGIGGSSNVYLNNTLIGSGMAVSFSAPSYPLTVYFSYMDGIYFNKAYPSGTLSITSNGTYSVYGYSSASVDVAGGGDGFTADEIAMRTISGDISGSATNIVSYAFYRCSALTTASFPNATSIGTSVFYNCRSLTTAYFPSVTSIDTYAFGYCTSLTIASFPNAASINTSAFYYCSALTTASFPSATSIGSNAFCSCISLTTAYFPSVTSIGTSAFGYCSKLTIASFPNATYIGNYAFYNCKSLTTASFPSATSIGTSAFCSCISLTTAYFPSATSIGTSAFCSCISLTTAYFPSATRIGSNAFFSCTALTTADFPNATYIGNSAFAYCYNFLSLYLLGSSVPTLGTNALLSTPIGGYTTSTGGVYGSIFVPSSLYNSYLTATNWSIYSARIVSV